MKELNALHTSLNGKAQKLYLLLLCLIFSFSLSTHSFSQEVKASIDTTDIRYGEEIKYTISVKLDSIQDVVFPEGQTFSPFETIEFYPIDTLTKKHLFELKRTYGITHFDSGSYKLPKQFVLIDDKPIETQSFDVNVHEVVVDTIAQPMYNIKPFLPVKRAPLPWKNILIWVIAALLIGLILWYLFIKKKKSSKEDIPLLPPLEEAIQAFKELDTSNYLQQNKSKEYYSRLTNILKRYLDREVTEDALESTTSELMMRLYAFRDSGKIPFDRSLLRDLELALKRSDLIKFANMRHEEQYVDKDRILMETMIVETDKILPKEQEEEESEEAIQARLEQERIERKKKRKVWATSLAGILLLIGLGYGIYQYYDKTTNTNDPYSEWITSAYGYPPLEITTPEVLVRTDEFSIKIPGTNEVSTFTSGRLDAAIYVMVESLTKNIEQPPSPEDILNLTFDQLENNGVENLLIKKDGFTIEDQAMGIKAFGRFSIKNKQGKNVPREYELYLINQNTALYQVLIIYPEGDSEKEKIKDRIIDSIKFQKDN